MRVLSPEGCHPTSFCHGRGIWQAPARAQKPQAHSCLCLRSRLLPCPLATRALVNHSSDTFSSPGFLSAGAKSKSGQQQDWKEATGLPSKLRRSNAVPRGQGNPRAGTEGSDATPWSRTLSGWHRRRVEGCCGPGVHRPWPGTLLAQPPAPDPAGLAPPGGIHRVPRERRASTAGPHRSSLLAKAFSGFISP